MEGVGDVVRNSSGDPFTIWLDTISMAITRVIWVEPDDSEVVDEVLEVLDLLLVRWALW